MTSGKNDVSRIRKTVAIAFIAVLVFGAFAVVAPSGMGSYPASIDSNWTGSPPAIDGNLTVGEWDNATAIDLFDIAGNRLQASILAMNDANLLYLCYDAVGDKTLDPLDSASVAFDTGHDEILTVGKEDQFVISEAVDETAHLVYNLSGWVIEDSPFNQSLPNHTGLAGQKGFGPSVLEPADHNIFEFSIPLALLGVSPGDSI
ncbi:MAG: hypothetical protein KAW09_03725, partial [Thermoplasmata archaeon]|nr:hypothetical protein [Thermoplasmata archaeon]